MRHALALLVLLCTAVPASAQYPPIRDPYLTFTYGTASRAQDAHQQGRFPLYGEDLAFDVLHSLDRSEFLDVGLGARVWRGLFLGVAYTARREESREGQITAFVPHPVFYDTYRSGAGVVPAVGHTEHTVHVQAMWRFAPAPALQIGVFGGPSIFSLSHELVEDFAVTEVGSGFSEVSFGEATIRRESEGAFGAHAGVDAMYRIARHVGLGAMVRYSRGTADVAIFGSRPLELTVGGLDAGLRVRIGF